MVLTPPGLTAEKENRKVLLTVSVLVDVTVVGSVASTLVNRYSPPAVAPLTPAMIVVGSPGAKVMSYMPSLPVVSGSTLPSPVTSSFVNEMLARLAVALVERNSPLGDSGGRVPPNVLSPPSPWLPVVVVTNTVAGSVGCTRIWEMPRPVNAPVAICDAPVGLIGPTRFAVVVALSTRYRPTTP